MISNNHSFEVHDEEIEEKRGNLLTAAFKKKRKMKCHQKYHLLHPKEIQYFFSSRFATYLVHPRRLQHHPNQNQFRVVSKSRLGLHQSKEWF